MEVQASSHVAMDPPTAQDQPDTLSASLNAVADMLETDAPSASLRAGAILGFVPGQQQALLLFACAYRVMNELVGAREIFGMLADEHPQLAAIHYELALVLARSGARREAIEHLERAVELEPNHPSAWRALGNQRALEGDSEGAGKAYARHLRGSIRELKLLEEAADARAEDYGKAEQMMLQSLAVNPTDVSILHLLAEVLARQGRFQNAESLLERALEIAPDYHGARQSYSSTLTQQYRWREAMAQLDIILKDQPEKPQIELLKAWNLVMIGDYEPARVLLEKVRPALENDAPFWLNYGHFLRTVGRSQEAVDAYRRTVELSPGIGLAWWSLANLKTYRFTATEIATMQQELERGDLDGESSCHIELALATALEAEKAYAESFEHYRNGNMSRRSRLHYDANESDERVRSTKALFTPEFIRAREGHGCTAPDPIFIVGMPRAGSTLVEQILASHSQVEGTAELPDMTNVVWSLRKGADVSYAELLAGLNTSEMKALGEKYLETTRYQRKLGKPFFTDKSPQNFLHTGFIHLVLPNAKIIDARRHPMSCCFSGYKQCFNFGSMPHSYDLSEVGRYYRNYVELMAHFDRVLPGRVHRVFHEAMVRDSEGEIRRLLEFCGLPFEEQCLRFHETDRGVRTASSEQVRRPIFKEKVEPWTHYDAWLGPLKDALGDVLTLYPDVPDFDGASR